MTSWEAVQKNPSSCTSALLRLEGRGGGQGVGCAGVYHGRQGSSACMGWATGSTVHAACNLHNTPGHNTNQTACRATATRRHAVQPPPARSPLLVGPRRLHKHASGGVAVQLHKARGAVQRGQAAI